MRRTCLTSLLLAAGLLALGGCAPKAVEMTYEPPLGLDDLAPGLPAAEDAYRLLADEQTVGRFAAVLAVAQLTVRDHGQDYRLRFTPLRPAEQAFWTEQMRGLSAIRELMFITPRSTRLRGDDLAGLLDAARRLGATLLLVYAPNGLGPNSAQVLGVLYEVATERPLATFHAAATIIDEEGREVSPCGAAGDRRQDDARFQARRQFERHVQACLRELILRDTPAPTTQPHRWETPFIERWWVPQRHR